MQAKMKVFSIIIVLLAVLLVVPLYANQAKSIALVKQQSTVIDMSWNKTFGGMKQDVAYTVVQTSDGGYAIAGWTESFGAGNEDAWLMKTDANGNAQWNRTYGGTVWERGYCLIQTADGGYAIAGETRPSASLYSNRDFWIVKTDANGNMEWNNTYGGTNQEEAYSVIQTGDMGYAVAGRTLSFGVSGYENMWLVKTDSNGNMQWNKAYGGTGIEIAYSVIQTDDEGYAISGESGSSTGERDMWLVKTDATGNMQWQKTYGLAGSIFEFSTSLILTTDRGFALAGGIENPVGTDHADFYLVKTDKDGNMLWNKTYGGETGEVAWDAIQTSDGGYALAGYTTSFGAGGDDFWVVKTDASGNMQWNETYGGASDDQAYSMIQTSDGGYAIAGVWSLGSESGDFWLMKIDLQDIDSEYTPFWMQWWFWTNIILGISTGIFAITTVYYRKKAFVPKEPMITPTKPISKGYKACPNCGANVPADSKFCGKCGISLE